MNDTDRSLVEEYSGDGNRYNATGQLCRIIRDLEAEVERLMRERDEVVAAQHRAVVGWDDALRALRAAMEVKS